MNVSLVEKDHFERVESWVIDAWSDLRRVGVPGIDGAAELLYRSGCRWAVAAVRRRLRQPRRGSVLGLERVPVLELSDGGDPI